MRRAAEIFLLALFLALGPSDSLAVNVTLTVSSDGSGNFTSIQRALDWCSPGTHPDLGHVTLLLRGVFFESVEVYSNFTSGVSFIGTGNGPLEALIINDRPGTVYSWLSATVKIDSDDFFAHNVAFANNASNYNHSEAGQSLALYLNADRAALDNCALLGGQDTLCEST
jgi:pectinesterase